MKKGALAGLGAGLALMVGGAAAPAPALAEFHLMKVREVYPSAGNDDYVELQMYAPGQNQTAGHRVDVYPSLGIPVHSTLLPNVPNRETQRTILIGNTGTAALPEAPTPDVQDALLQLDPAGGAVCFPDATPADCVTWGTFLAAANALLPDPQSANAAAPAAGMSLTRSIAPGCATLLEPGDDTDNSSTDFASGSRTPRGNNVAPTETPCAGGGGGGGGGDYGGGGDTGGGGGGTGGGDTGGDGGDTGGDDTGNGGKGGGGGTGGGSDESDTIPPATQVRGPATQNVDRLSLRVSPDEDATIVGTGGVTVGKAKRLFKFRKVTAFVAAGETAKLRFKLARKARKQVKRALKKRAPAAKLTVTATDAAGNSSITRRTVKLAT